MSYRYYLERNGHKYAYECTSKRVKGKKNPVSQKVYLGKVDPETGNIIPRNTNPTPKEEYAKFYGNVQVLDAVQERLGIYDDLKSTFTTLAPNIMGAAMSLAISPSTMDSIHYTVENSTIQEKYKLRGTLSPSVICNLSEEIGGAPCTMEQFFRKRVERSSSSYYSLDLTSVSTYSKLCGWAQWGHNRDNESLKQTNIAMVTDACGIPIMFQMLPGSVADMAIMQSLVDDMKRIGCMGRLVMDRGFESAKNVLHLLNLGTDFTIPSNIKTEPIKKLLAMALPLLKLPESCDYYDGVAYKHAEFEVGIIQNDENAEYVIKVPKNQKDAKRINQLFDQSKKLKAFVVFDSKKATDDFQNRMEMVHNIELKFENTNQRDPKKTYMEFPSFVRKYLDYKVDERGLFHLIRKRNAFTFAENRAGLFIMLTSKETTFEEMMTSYDVRDQVEKAYDVYKNDLNGDRLRTGNPERARGRFFLKFISLIMRIEIQNILRKHDAETIKSKQKADSVNGMTVNDVLFSLNTLCAIGNVGEWRLTAVTKNVREIYKVFGLPEPKSGQIILS